MPKFEPLVIGMMQYYTQTHDTLHQQEILDTLTTLIHFGIDFSKLDKGSTFVNYVTNQILGKKSYLKNPPKILPFIFNFFSALSVECSQLIDPNNLLKLTSCVFSAPYWKLNGELLPSIKYLLKDLFHRGKRKRGYNLKQREELREHFLSCLISKIPFPQAVNNLAIILRQTRNKRPLFQTYSSAILETLFTFIAKGNLIADTQQVRKQILVFAVFKNDS